MYKRNHYRRVGTPTDVGISKNGVFKYLKDIIWSNVHGWKVKLLPSRGKEILIKFVAHVVTFFSIACFKLPRGLCDHINSLIRKSKWGNNQRERKTSWVSWETMTKPKYMGSLGFRDTEQFNLSLSARHKYIIRQCKIGDEGKQARRKGGTGRG